MKYTLTKVLSEFEQAVADYTTNGDTNDRLEFWRQALSFSLRELNHMRLTNGQPPNPNGDYYLEVQYAPATSRSSERRVLVLQPTIPVTGEPEPRTMVVRARRSTGQRRERPATRSTQTKPASSTQVGRVSNPMGPNPELPHDSN